jgi:uncharacterized pyridoxamine 5'-phosphate oxidase family protein
MPVPITTQQVWQALEKQLFAVLGTVTHKVEPRTVGIVYVVRGRKIFISAERSSWKVKHIQENRNVSLTVPIAKRIPFVPWVRIPAATITFQGEASIRGLAEVPQEIQNALLHGLEMPPDQVAGSCIIEVEPKGQFLTYGIAVSVLTMRKPKESRGRAPVKD